MRELIAVLNHNTDKLSVFEDGREYGETTEHYLESLGYNLGACCYWCDADIYDDRFLETISRQEIEIENLNVELEKQKCLVAEACRLMFNYKSKDCEIDDFVSANSSNKDYVQYMLEGKLEQKDVEYILSMIKD